MATATTISFFLRCALVVLYSTTLLLYPVAEGGPAAARHVIRSQALFPSNICSPSGRGSSRGTGSLEVFQLYGPCSPLSGKAHQILDRDQKRVEEIHRHRNISAAAAASLGGSLAAVSIPDSYGGSLGTGDYVVNVGFGTPAKTFTVFFDTGSDVTWIQCLPCAISCYKQKDPIFNPAQSSTYSNITCSSIYCSQLEHSGCSGNTCLYGVEYGDGSHTAGYFASDTLTLTPTDVFYNFRFGCGQDNVGIFGETDGLLGLGREPVSTVSQTSAKYGGVFSYCLPSTPSFTGYLAFGGSPPSNSQYTPMLASASSQLSHYYLSMVGISVGGTQLSIAPSVFSTAGTIIDSGTVISRLPPEAYSALRTAFRKQMSKYPTAPPSSPLDTCYDFTNYPTVNVPTVVLQFDGGVVLQLDVLGILYPIKLSQVCLAFAGNSAATDLAIFGNVQQRTFSVYYNIPALKIGFAAAGCS